MEILKKIFVFLQEKNIINKIKQALCKLIDKHGDVVKVKIKEFVNNKTPEAKENLIEFISNNIKLSFPLNLFKKTIIKTVDKNITELVLFINNKLSA
jgi:hypothetical protein